MPRATLDEKGRPGLSPKKESVRDETRKSFRGDDASQVVADG
jgi:hypothetical protein